MTDSRQKIDARFFTVGEVALQLNVSRPSAGQTCAAISLPLSRHLGRTQCSRQAHSNWIQPGKGC
jgi:hypothetical protein